MVLYRYLVVRILYSGTSIIRLNVGRTTVKLADESRLSVLFDFSIIQARLTQYPGQASRRKSPELPHYHNATHQMLLGANLVL